LSAFKTQSVESSEIQGFEGNGDERNGSYSANCSVQLVILQRINLKKFLIKKISHISLAFSIFNQGLVFRANRRRSIVV